MSFLPVIADGIPASMKALDHWVHWHSETKKSSTKLTKVPYQVGLHRKAKSNSPATWSSFEQCLKPCCACGNGHHFEDGIGFMLAGSGKTFIDFDHVRNPETGEIMPWAAAVIGELKSFCEVSPTGTGVHGFIEGTFSGK